MLCVIGDLVEDIIVRPIGSRRHPDTDNPAVIERRRGGSAANVAAAAATLGAAVRFVGRVGDDRAAAVLVADLVSRGVEVCVQRAGRTGTVAIVVEPGGVRTMYPDRGAAAELGAIDPCARTSVSWVHLPAYTWCVPPLDEHAAAFVEAVRGDGDLRLSVDLSSTALLETVGAAAVGRRLAALAPDVVFATIAEWTTSGQRPVAGAVTVVKDGPRAVRVHHRDGRSDEVAVVAIDDIVDPTGAGDAFAAGYIVAARSGVGPVDAARAGIDCAARTLRRVGASLD
ncbi:MAG: carbohydrate kinase family protein [Desertimonas sp.]